MCLQDCTIEDELAKNASSEMVEGSCNESIIECPLKAVCGQFAKLAKPHGGNTTSFNDESNNNVMKADNATVANAAGRNADDTNFPVSDVLIVTDATGNGAERGDLQTGIEVSGIELTTFASECESLRISLPIFSDSDDTSEFLVVSLKSLASNKIDYSCAQTYIDERVTNELVIQPALVAISEEPRKMLKLEQRISGCKPSSKNKPSFGDRVESEHCETGASVRHSAPGSTSDKPVATSKRERRICSRKPSSKDAASVGDREDKNSGEASGSVRPPAALPNPCAAGEDVQVANDQENGDSQRRSDSMKEVEAAVGCMKSVAFDAVMQQQSAENIGESAPTDCNCGSDAAVHPASDTVHLTLSQVNLEKNRFACNYGDTATLPFCSIGSGTREMEKAVDQHESSNGVEATIPLCSAHSVTRETEIAVDPDDGSNSVVAATIPLCSSGSVSGEIKSVVDQQDESSNGIVATIPSCSADSVTREKEIAVDQEGGSTAVNGRTLTTATLADAGQTCMTNMNERASVTLPIDRDAVCTDILLNVHASVERLTHSVTPVESSAVTIDQVNRASNFVISPSNRSSINGIGESVDQLDTGGTENKGNYAAFNILSLASTSTIKPSRIPRPTNFIRIAKSRTPPSDGLAKVSRIVDRKTIARRSETSFINTEQTAGDETVLATISNVSNLQSMQHSSNTVFASACLQQSASSVDKCEAQTIRCDDDVERDSSESDDRDWDFIRVSGARKNATGGRIYDKEHFCLFCGSPYTKMARHLVSVHSDETDVIALTALPEKSVQRRLKLELLLRRGDFQHNHEVLLLQKGTLVLMRRPNEKELALSSYDDYGPCPDCLGFLHKRHM